MIEMKGKKLIFELCTQAQCAFFCCPPTVFVQCMYTPDSRMLGKVRNIQIPKKNVREEIVLVILTRTDVKIVSPNINPYSNEA